MKKRYLILALAAVFMMFAAATAYTQTTATEDIAVSWASNDNVLLLEVDNNTYDLSSTGLSGSDSYSASEPGARATSSTSTDSARGGVLNYTLHGQSTSKVTVHSNTSGYGDGTLGVQVSTDGATEEIIYGDGGDTTGMTNTSDELGTVAAGPVGIQGTALDLITDIAGADSWTGTSGDPTSGSQGGAPLYYTLNTSAGVSSVEVTYTITAQ